MIDVSWHAVGCQELYSTTSMGGAEGEFTLRESRPRAFDAVTFRPRPAVLHLCSMCAPLGGIRAKYAVRPGKTCQPAASPCFGGGERHGWWPGRGTGLGRLECGRLSFQGGIRALRHSTLGAEARFCRLASEHGQRASKGHVRQPATTSEPHRDRRGWQRGCDLCPCAVAEPPHIGNRSH
jgi:hypothetical protein